jgi:hypothetical protein
MFWGESEFKTPMPPNVIDSGYSSYIKSKTAILFSDQEVEAIVAAIKGGMLPKTWATRTRHVASLRERFSDTSSCPKCGSPLVLRTVKSGLNEGRQFYGCSSYPACRHIKNIEPVRS